MNKIIFVFAYLAVSSVYAQSIQGDWVEESKDKKSDGSPKYVFTINVDKDGSTISGEYCYIYQYGGRINCDNKFTGIKYNDGYKLSLEDGGLADIKQTRNTLIWKLIQNSKGSEFVLPQNSILSINSSNITYLKINKTMAFIYKQPNDNAKTKSYLIKGNKVIQEEEKGDWLKVKYADKSVGWIHKNVVN